MARTDYEKVFVVNNLGIKSQTETSSANNTSVRGRFDGKLVRDADG